MFSFALIVCCCGVLRLLSALLLLRCVSRACVSLRSPVLLAARAKKAHVRMRIPEIAENVWKMSSVSVFGAGLGID